LARYLEITFPDEGVSARALLLEDEAPNTCRRVWEILPLSGEGGHANYSGTMVGLLFDPSVTIPEENPITWTQVGDVVFTHYDHGFAPGHREALSEIYWSYDRFGRPVVPGKWVPAVANLFARIVGDATAFYEVSRRTSREGFKRMEIKGVTDD
jgi:hypothetical protein